MAGITTMRARKRLSVIFIMLFLFLSSISLVSPTKNAGEATSLRYERIKTLHIDVFFVGTKLKSIELRYDLKHILQLIM